MTAAIPGGTPIEVRVVDVDGVLAGRLTGRVTEAGSRKLTVYGEIAEERRRAAKKHGSQSIEAMHGFDWRWLPVLVEEVGEAATVLLESRSQARRLLRAELMQVAAVATAWVDALDRDQAKDGS